MGVGLQIRCVSRVYGADRVTSVP